VVPLESDLVTSVDGDGLGGLDAGGVALNVLGGDVQDRVVVRRRVDVAALLVAYTLVLSVDENVPVWWVSVCCFKTCDWNPHQTVVWAAAN
jgi:hypothetical protein